jgi:DNA mismatch repair ATPase MutL
MPGGGRSGGGDSGAPSMRDGGGPSESPRMKGVEERSGGALKEKSASEKSATDKAPSEKAASDERRNKNEPKQAGDTKRDDKMQRSDSERGKDGSRDKESSSTGASSGESGSGSADKADRSSSKGASANLSGEQRTKVQSVFKSHKSASVNVNVDVRVGAVVPRSVTLVAVPQEVVILVPGWQRYRYILIGDTVCIVDPDTYEIVDVIVVS